LRRSVKQQASLIYSSQDFYSLAVGCKSQQKLARDRYPSTRVSRQLPMEPVERQHYSEEVEKHVLTRYELCQRLGKGAFGIVWKVIEKKSRKVMALKKCYDAFRSSEDAQATYREIMYLTEMAGHDNIVRLLMVRLPDDQPLTS